MDLLAHRRRINCSERNGPASSNGRLELIGRDRAETDDAAHAAILRQPNREALVTPPSARSPSVINEIAGLDAPTPKVSKRVELSVDLDSAEMALAAAENAPSDPARISPAA